MYKVFEVDYNNKSYLIATTDNLTEAKRKANKAFKKSHGEFVVFVTDESKDPHRDGTKVVYNKIK